MSLIGPVVPEGKPVWIGKPHKADPTPEASTLDLPEVTDRLLAALEFRYASPRVCRVCGAPLEMGNSGTKKYNCTSDAASPFRDRQKAAGVTWKEALDHWGESTMYSPEPGDLDVIALIAEVRRLR
jgi:hypothetical protein